VKLLKSALFWRILLSSLFVVLVLGVGLYRAVVAHQHLTDQFDRLVNHDLELADDAEEMLRVLADMEAGKQGYLLTLDVSRRDLYEQARSEMDLKIGEARKAAESPTGSQSEMRQIEEFLQLEREWVDNVSDPQIAERVRSDALDPQKTARGKRLTDEMRALGFGLRDEAVQLATRRQSDAFGTAVSSRRETTVWIGIAIVMALAFGIFIARDLSSATSQLEDALAATGRMEDLPPLPARRDELGSVGQSLVKMSALLYDKDAKLRATLSERERAVGDLTRANERLAQRDTNARTYAEFVRELKTLDVAELSVSGLQTLVKLAHAHVGVVYLLDGANRLVPVHAATIDAHVVEHSLFSGDGLPRAVMSRQEPVVIHAQNLGDKPPTVSLGVATAALNWVLAHPIAVGPDAAGAVLLAGLAPFAEGDEELVRDAARQLAVGLHNAWTHDRLREKSKMLAEQGETLARANKVKTEFLASMSHELRTPLSAILGFTDLLATSPKETLSSRARESLERIKRNGEHLLSLINDVLDLAKAEAGRTEIRLATVNVSQLARACVAEVDSLRAGKDLRLAAEVPDSPVEIVSDSQRVRQILLNLLSNALKFTERGEVVLTMRAAANEVRIAVRDTGIGIPANAIGELFQDFHQLEKGDGKKYEGTGVGLALSRRLARALGGEIEVRSREHEGSTFTLVLPRVAVNVPVVDEPTSGRVLS
jgi:signal transduction histidine kinase/CHASE3 domain sensor protein